MSDQPPIASAETLQAEKDRITSEILGYDRGTDPFVAAVRATRMPMIITDPKLPDNPVVFVNDAFCRLTGYRRDEILGRNCRFLQGLETDPATVRLLREAVEKRQSIQTDIRNYRKDGSTFWNRLLLAPVNDANGNLAYFFASQVDVTLERERLAGLESKNAALMAEIGDRMRALSDSEERLNLATQAGGIGVWELDIATSTLHSSRLCRQVFGRDPDLPWDYAGWLDAVHTDDRERVEQAMRRSIDAGDDLRTSYQVVQPSGKIVWVDIDARVQKDGAGRPQRIVGTCRDVSAQRAAEERTRLLLELDRDVFSSLDDPAEIAYRAAEALGRAFKVSRAGYGTINKADETITIERDWNMPGIETLAGTLHFRDYGSYIDDLKIGRCVVFDDAREDPRSAENADALIAISAQAIINQPVNESGDLVALLYLNHATARHWSEEEITLVREVATRIRLATERRRAEQELRALAASLEVQVQERSAKLLSAEAALRQSQKMEAVGQLTGGIAHDFNNLLAAISGAFEVLQRKQPQPGSPDFDRLIDIGKTSSRKAAALTHRLLAFSRQQTLEPKLINANKLIAGMEELVRRTIGPDITLEVVAAVGLWHTEVDPSQLENALLNLCINARDAMPGGGLLTIETANRWVDATTAEKEGISAGQYVSMCVSDNGTGMPAEVIERAFDPFFTTKPLGTGTGLGLSMVYGFAKQSNGHARIYSEEGKGTMVCVYLPRKDGAPDMAAEVPRPVLQPLTAGAGQTVLVVDDEDAVRALAVDTLREAGYSVFEAADGMQATALLQSLGRLDLLVTDVGLPGGMNGRQVADAAQRLRPGLKILFITGYAENAVLSHGHLSPGMHIMTKPFELAVFARRVQALLDAGTDQG